MERDSVLSALHVRPAQALQSIDGILDRILEAVNLETLKCVREISSRWHLFATRELRNQVTIRICYDSSCNRDMGLFQLEGGILCLSNIETMKGDVEEIVVLRRTDDPFHPQPSPSLFTIPNLIRLIRKNPRGFPCVSYEITTQLLGSEQIKYFLQCVGTTIRRLKVVLHYFVEFIPSDLFQGTLIPKDLRALLLFRTPYLEHFHLVVQLSRRFCSHVLNLRLDPHNNFLDDESACLTKFPGIATGEGRFGGRGPRPRRLLFLKSFTYEGLLPKQIVHDIIQASVNLRRVKEVESAAEFAKRVDQDIMQPPNPYFTQLLEWATGKYTGNTFYVKQIYFADYFLQNDAYPPYVQLYNEIMESHSQTLIKISFRSCNFCDDLRIPAMPNLKILEFHWYCNSIQLLVESEKGKDGGVSTECQLARKFPKLQLLSFPKKFKFGAHFAPRLGVDTRGPFPSIKTVQTTADCPWDVIDRLCTEMSEVFPNAQVCIGPNRELLPAFSLNQKPPSDPRQVTEHPQ